MIRVNVPAAQRPRYLYIFGHSETPETSERVNWAVARSRLEAACTTREHTAPTASCTSTLTHLNHHGSTMPLGGLSAPLCRTTAHSRVCYFSFQMHDWFSDILTGGLIIGLWVSYLPQVTSFFLSPRVNFEKKLIDRIDDAALDLRHEALPHYLQGHFGGIQPMVSPSWKHFFRIGHAQHVCSASPLLVPTVGAFLIYVPQGCHATHLNRVLFPLCESPLAPMPLYDHSSLSTRARWTVSSS